MCLLVNIILLNLLFVFINTTALILVWSISSNQQNYGVLKM